MAWNWETASEGLRSLRNRRQLRHEGRLVRSVRWPFDPRSASLARFEVALACFFPVNHNPTR